MFALPPISQTLPSLIFAAPGVDLICHLPYIFATQRIQNPMFSPFSRKTRRPESALLPMLAAAVDVWRNRNRPGVTAIGTWIRNAPRQPRERFRLSVTCMFSRETRRQTGSGRSSRRVVPSSRRSLPSRSDRRSTDRCARLSTCNPVLPKAPTDRRPTARPVRPEAAQLAFCGRPVRNRYQNANRPLNDAQHSRATVRPVPELILRKGTMPTNNRQTPMAANINTCSGSMRRWEMRCGQSTGLGSHRLASNAIADRAA